MQEETVIRNILHLDDKRSALFNRREQMILQFSQAARSKDKGGRLRRLHKTIQLTNEFIDTLDHIAAEMQPKADSSVPRFVVSSYFLHQCFKKLTADRNEQFSFITGIEVNGAFVLDQLIELVHEKRSMLGVVADARFTHKLLITLEQFKHRLLGHFHSHPGDGAESTRPSGADEDFQSRLERAGHMAVAAIFSRDGYVRFFRMDGNFEVEVYGEGVERYEKNVFRITELS